MSEKKPSVNITGLKAGLIVSISLIIYFMIMRFFNLTGSVIAWSFNLVILFTGIYFTYRYYRIKTKPNIDYLPGMLLGSITTLVSAGIFTIFVYLFFSSVDASQLLLLNDNILFLGEGVTALRVAGATVVEGISSGIVISFMMMQYYKSGFKISESDENDKG